MNLVPKITLDTNCVINLFDQKVDISTSVDSLEELIRLSFSNKVKIAITTRTEADLENDKNDMRRNNMMRAINLFPIIGTITRPNISRLDKGDMLSGDETKELFDTLQKIIFPGGLNKNENSYLNKVNDLDHLIGHILNKRDIFVTDDRGVWKKKDVLKYSPGVVVMLPKECVEYIHAIEEKKEKRLFDPPILKKYYSPAFSGRVIFDYSNNNGRFTIGEGYYLFETHWSSAGTDSIHVYSGSDSVATIALAKGITEIKQIKNGGDYDGSSFARSPNEGQIIILKNKNNIFAAIKVIDVKYDGRGDDRYELTFEYVINPDGTADFTK